MKTIAQIIFIIIGIIAVAMLFQSCTNEQYSVEQSVLVDLTEDSFLVKPNAEAHKKLFENNRGLFDGFRFRVMAITDVEYNPVYESSVAPTCELISNLYNRKKEMKVFYAKNDSAMKTVLETTAGKTKSSIYFPMVMELNRLSKANARRKILTIYSDLNEHTALVSFYDKKILNLLKSEPEAVRRILEAEVSLNDLSGIEIFFVYQPREAKESADFRTISAFFKNWLEEKGAKVSISGNLSSQ